MAFIGLMIANIILMIMFAVIVFVSITFIIGICIRKKHKTVSTILFVLDIVAVVMLAVPVYTLTRAPSETVEMNGQDVVLKGQWISSYENAMNKRKYKKLDRLLNEHPALIQYTDINGYTLLEYAKKQADVKMMKIAVKHGAKFDDPLVFDHLRLECSADDFWDSFDGTAGDRHEPGKLTEDLFDTVKFMVEHGAKMAYEQNNGNGPAGSFYYETVCWVCQDGAYSDREYELLDIVREAEEKQTGTEIPEIYR